MYFGLDNPGIAGGDGSPSLLGGVLNGETSAGSVDDSGAKVERCGGSTD